jgi:hypothetical protein
MRQQSLEDEWDEEKRVINERTGLLSISKRKSSQSVHLHGLIIHLLIGLR